MQGKGLGGKSLEVASPVWSKYRGKSQVMQDPGKPSPVGGQAPEEHSQGWNARGSVSQNGGSPGETNLSDGNGIDLIAL
jgi:hypothetical protein